MSSDNSQDNSLIKLISKSYYADSEFNENENSKTEPYSKNEWDDENNDKKNIEFNEANNIILIQRQKNEIQFFIHKKGYTPRICKEKKDTKIRDILYKYIKNIGEKEEIINHFYYENKLIDNLDCTFIELGIHNLSFISCKY